MDLPDMPTRSSQPTRSVVVVSATILVSLAAGCSSPASYSYSGSDVVPLERPDQMPPPKSAGSPSVPSSSSVAVACSNGAFAELIAQPHWIRSVPSPDGQEPDYRWIYPDLEAALFEAPQGPVDLRPYLENSNPTTAANAAVMLARTGKTDTVEALATAAASSRLDVKVRCAAAETLGRIPAGLESLRRLADDEAGRARASYSPAVHAELIRALGRQVEPAQEPRLAAALDARDDSVKLAALEVWGQAAGGAFPEQGLALRNHADPRIRAQLVSALARHPVDDALERLVQALSDPELQVRCTAIRAMGVLRDKRAVASLEQLLETGAEGERIAALRALADLGKAELVAAGANDKAWRVRLAVAELLPSLPGGPNAALAQKLLNDPSAEVQHQAVAGLGTCTPEVSEPLLIDALEKCPYRSQKLAAETLSATWPEGRPLLEAFPFGQPPAARASALAAIRQAYADRSTAAAAPKHEDTPAAGAYTDQQLAPVVAALQTLQIEGSDPAVGTGALAALRRIGPDLLGMLEYLVEQRGVVLPESLFADVLAPDLPDFAAVERLRRDDVQARRRAARELSERFAHRRPAPLLLRRLADLVIPEADAVVWQYVLAALAEQDDERTFRLVYAAAGHSSAGIRQAACRHLARHPRPQHVPVLVGALHDSSASVACAAVEALGLCGQVGDHEAIVQLLGSRYESVQIAAAAALTRLGRSEGQAALERLACSADEETRLLAARAMGELALPEFAPTLIRLLDDRHGIRLAALDALPKVARCEEAEAGNLRESERVEAWKKWGEDKSEARISKYETNTKR